MGHGDPNPNQAVSPACPSLLPSRCSGNPRHRRTRAALRAGTDHRNLHRPVGEHCSFAGNQPGTFTAYIVCRPDITGVAAVEFAAPVPPCLGAVIEAENAPTGALVIGSVETGISIAFPTCSASPRVVLKLIIFRSGATDSCCAYPILAHPTTGIVSTINCSGAGLQTTGLVSYFNADASCSCVGNSAPSIPGYPIPPDNAEGVTRRPSLSWMRSDVDGNLAEYDLYLGTTPTPPLAAAHLTQPSYLPALLEPSTRYYWRVVARDFQPTGGVRGLGQPQRDQRLDPTGRIVRTLVDESQTGGLRQAVWNGRDENGGAVSSGVYFSVLQAGGERRTRKLVLLK